MAVSRLALERSSSASPTGSERIRPSPITKIVSATQMSGITMPVMASQGLVPISRSSRAALERRVRK